MKRNINKQKENIFTMKNALYFMLIVLLSMLLGGNSAFANEQTHLVWYPMESPSATTIYDASGDSHNSVLFNGASSTTTNLIWGTRNLQCDGTNDYAVSSSSINLTPQYSVSLWVRPSSSGTKDYWTTLDDGIDTTFELEYDGTSQILELGYFNNNGTYTHRIIDNFLFATNNWYHIAVTIDADNDRYSYYKNGQPVIVNGIFPDGYKYNPNLTKDIHLCINRDFNLSKIFGGKIDEYRVFNFQLGINQVQELFNANNITFYYTNQTNVTIIGDNRSITTYYGDVNNLNNNVSNQNLLSQNQSIQLIINNYLSGNGGNESTNLSSTTWIASDLINSTNIASGDGIENTNDLNVLLNDNSICQLYVDYNLIYTSSNPIYSFSYPLKDLQVGQHSYFVSCLKQVDNNIYFDITGLVNFNITPSTKTIDFNFFNVNNEHLLGEDYYFVTPCFESLSTYWIFENDYYIKNIEDGFASFNLSYTSQHEFCIYRGTINFDDGIDGYTNNFDIVEIKNTIELGNIFVGETTKSYNLKLSNEDIYKPTEPEFWGKTWASLFSFIAGLLIGGALILLGMYAKSDKLMVVGGFIIMAGLGVSVWTFVGAIF